MNEKIDRNFVHSLAKGLQLMMGFSKEHPKLTLTEVARLNGMNLPTARRYLHTLVKLDFVVKDDADQTFQLTPKVIRLSSGVFGALDLRARLLPYMRSITRELDVTTHCAVLAETEVVTVERLRSKDVVNLDITVGTHLPVYATSLGKAILAFLPTDEQKRIIARIDFKPFTPNTLIESQSLKAELEETRRRRYAVAVEELTLGLKTMAVPIFDSLGRVEASFGVSFPVTRAVDEDLGTSLIKRLLKISDQVTTRA